MSIAFQIFLNAVGIVSSIQHNYSLVFYFPMQFTEYFQKTGVIELILPNSFKKKKKTNMLNMKKTTNTMVFDLQK